MANDIVQRPSRAKSAKRARTESAAAIAGETTANDIRGFLDAIDARRSTMTYAAKRSVFRQGDPADAVFFIEKGRVRLTVVSDQGKEGVIAILGPGEFFGEGCLAGQPLYLSTASTMSTAEIVRIERERMIALLAQKPDLSQFFIGHLLTRNIRFESDLIDQLFNSSEKRLARVLLLLANFGKEGKMEMVIPPISQDVLAAKVGTTRSRINFFMNKFRKLGFIEYNGGLRVHSALLNVIVHD